MGDGDSATVRGWGAAGRSHLGGRGTEASVSGKGGAVEVEGNLTGA